MSDRFWFFAYQGQQYGPYPEAQFRDLVAQRTITAQTLVWSEGMTGWQRAGDIPGLLAAAPGALVLPPEALPAGGLPAVQSLSAELGTWELFGRGLLVMIGDLTVIAAPWTKTGFFRWFIAHLRIPQRPDITFTGRPGDIWYAFVFLALGIYAGLSRVPYLPYVLIPVQAAIWWIIVRWLVENVSPDGHQHPLTFTGGAWAYVGWYLLSFVSFITIVGWAWVWAAWARWMCRNVDGTRRQLRFEASGWQMLWRTLLFTLACGLIIPIPWALAWFARWSVSQFALVEPTA
jgi:hypothetical protein